MKLFSITTKKDALGNNETISVQLEPLGIAFMTLLSLFTSLVIHIKYCHGV